jgi:hypothetical protein
MRHAFHQLGLAIAASVVLGAFPAMTEAQPIEAARYDVHWPGAGTVITMSAWLEATGTSDGSGTQLFNYWLSGTRVSARTLLGGSMMSNADFGMLRFSARLAGSVATPDAPWTNAGLFAVDVPTSLTAGEFTTGPRVTTLANVSHPTFAFMSMGYSGCLYREGMDPLCDIDGWGQISPVRLLEVSPLIAPEPSTWALVGTGLLSLGGLAARNRKRAS